MFVKRVLNWIAPLEESKSDERNDTVVSEIKQREKPEKNVVQENPEPSTPSLGTATSLLHFNSEQNVDVSSSATENDSVRISDARSNNSDGDTTTEKSSSRQPRGKYSDLKDINCLPDNSFPNRLLKEPAILKGSGDGSLYRSDTSEMSPLCKKVLQTNFSTSLRKSCYTQTETKNLRRRRTLKEDIPSTRNVPVFVADVDRRRHTDASFLRDMPSPRKGAEFVPDADGRRPPTDESLLRDMPSPRKVPVFVPDLDRRRPTDASLLRDIPSPRKVPVFVPDVDRKRPTDASLLRDMPSPRKGAKFVPDIDGRRPADANLREEIPSRRKCAEFVPDVDGRSPADAKLREEIPSRRKCATFTSYGDRRWPTDTGPLSHQEYASRSKGAESVSGAEVSRPTDASLLQQEVPPSAKLVTDADRRRPRRVRSSLERVVPSPPKGAEFASDVILHDRIRPTDARLLLRQGIPSPRRGAAFMSDVLLQDRIRPTDARLLLRQKIPSPRWGAESVDRPTIAGPSLQQDEKHGGGLSTFPTPSPCVYGGLFVLGCNGKAPDHLKGQMECRYLLRKRPKPNGVKEAFSFVTSRKKPVGPSPGRHTVFYNVSTCRSVVVEYIRDRTTDMFQIGRYETHPVDFRVLDVDGGGSARNGVSRFACRIVVQRCGIHEARVYAAAFDATGHIFLGEGALTCVREGHMDGFTTNGVLVMHPTGVWREVSVCGYMYPLRSAAMEAKKRPRLPEESNILQDGTLIDLCGVTLMWRTPPGLKNVPTRESLKRVEFELSRWSPDYQLPRSPPLCKAVSQAFVFLTCGHVVGLFGHGHPLEGWTCPICHSVGPITRLRVGKEPGFYVDNDFLTHAFRPCGHAATLKTVRFWSTVKVPEHRNFQKGFCPFCGSKLNSVAKYIELIYPQ